MFECVKTRTRFGIVGVFGLGWSYKVNRNIVAAVGPLADKAQTTTFDEERNTVDDLCGVVQSKIADTAGNGVKEPASKFHRTYFIQSIELLEQLQAMPEEMTSLMGAKLWVIEDSSLIRKIFNEMSIL